jgi:hypothetical protein
MSTKHSLNLTVRERFIRLARELAKRRRRSVSALFEDLVEEEETRERAKKKTEKKPRNFLVGRDGRDGHRDKSPQWGKFLQIGAAIACALSLSGRSNLCYGKGLPDGHPALDPVNHIYRQI